MNPHNRQAYSTAEVTIVLVLLTLTMGGLGRFASSVGKLKRDASIAQHMQWDLVSARETIGSWEIEDITPDAIRSLPISTVVADHFPNAQWNATIVQVDGDTTNVNERSLRVRLSMIADVSSQSVEPASLVFWVVEPKEANARDAIPTE